MTRYARRTDANLTEIVKAYRKLGARVHVTNGDWDATVQFGGVTDIVEVKDGAKPPSQRKIRKGNQQRVHDTLMIRIVTGVDQVAEHVAALRRKSFVLMQGMK